MTQTDPEILVVDVETQQLAAEVGGWKHKDHLFISVAVTYDPSTETFKTYTEDQAGHLVLDLYHARKVIGFNLLNFDYHVMRGALNRRRTLPIEIAWLRTVPPDEWKEHIPTCDLLDYIRTATGHRVSLDKVAGATLNASKTGTGTDAVRLWKQGKIDELTEYCKQDVLLTWRIYEFGMDKGTVWYFGNNYKPRFTSALWSPNPLRY